MVGEIRGRKEMKKILNIEKSVYSQEYSSQEEKICETKENETVRQLKINRFHPGGTLYIMFNLQKMNLKFKKFCNFPTEI